MPTQEGHPEPTGGGQRRTPWAREEALQRLEDQLHSYPEDRALPAIEEILEAADVAPALLQDDDRARKLIVEALLVRPLSHLERVSDLRTEVELLTLEVQVLTDRLNHPGSGSREAGETAARLQQVRARLVEIRELL